MTYRKGFYITIFLLYATIMISFLGIWKVNKNQVELEKAYLDVQISRYVDAGIIPPDYIKTIQPDIRLKEKKWKKHIKNSPKM